MTFLLAARRRHGGVLVTLVLLTACGGSSNPPAPGPPGTGGGDAITGRERVGWVQPAQDAAQLATFDYAMYVDGTRAVLSGDTCAPGSGGNFDCSAPLPPLTAGQHNLELVAFTISNGVTLESERSASLRVTVAGSTAPAGSAPPDATVTTSEGHRVRTSIVARGLDDPTDLAIAPDGRIFVTERAGHVRLVAPDGAAESAALELTGVASGDDTGLTAIALHPEFERTGHVFLGYATEGDRRDAAGLRIVRFRERNGILAEAAVLARERASSPPHVVLRFGKDGKLYAAVAAGADPRDAQDAASALGKILRFNEDGSTPRDNPGATGMYSSGHRDPRALAWHPATGALWEVERDREAGDELNAVVAGADYGWPLVRGAMRSARSVAAVLVLPPGTEVSGAAFVPARSRSPFAGELLVASRGAEDLLRVRVGSGREPSGLVEGILQGRYGRLAAIAVAGDGTIYAATGNRDTWGAGRDVLLRIDLLTGEEEIRR